MKYTAHESNIRTIRQDEPGFYINNGLTIAPRAGVEYTNTCPGYVQQTINMAIAKGQIKLVANVKDNELVWETLGQ
jgi:hypothetical protein